MFFSLLLRFMFSMIAVLHKECIFDASLGPCH